MARIDALLAMMSERGASDLDLKAGSPPAIRVDGRLSILRDQPFLGADEMVAMARSRSYYIAGSEANRERTDTGLADLMSTLPALAEHGCVDLPYVTHAYRAMRP